MDKFGLSLWYKDDWSLDDFLSSSTILLLLLIDVDDLCEEDKDNVVVVVVAVDEVADWENEDPRLGNMRR